MEPNQPFWTSLWPLAGVFSLVTGSDPERVHLGIRGAPAPGTAPLPRMSRPSPGCDHRVAAGGAPALDFLPSC